MTWPAVSNRLIDSQQMVIHTVMDVHTTANIQKVEDFALSQEDKSRKQLTMENCITN